MFKKASPLPTLTLPLCDQINIALKILSDSIFSERFQTISCQYNSWLISLKSKFQFTNSEISDVQSKTSAPEVLDTGLRGRSQNNPPLVKDASSLEAPKDPPEKKIRPEKFFDETQKADKLAGGSDV